MAILQRLLPWIFFALGQLLLGRQWSAPLAAVAAVIIIGVALARGARPLELILDGATLVYFVGFSVLLWTSPGSPLIDFVAAGAQLFQGVIVLVFLLAKVPFTLPIARREAPAEVADSWPFFKFNVILSLIWVAAFLISGCVLVAMVLTGLRETWIQVLVIVAAVLIPSLIQTRLVKSVQDRAPEAAGAAQ